MTRGRAGTPRPQDASADGVVERVDQLGVAVIGSVITGGFTPQAKEIQLVYHDDTPFEFNHF
jgi:hypothetical protein